MTTLILAGAQQLGGALIQTAGSAALSFVSGAITRAFDNRTFEGPRLDSFHIQTSRDGAPMSRVYGRVRLAGQVIWASRLKEIVTEEEVQGGKGGGPTQRNYSYSISFAVGLCEGEILGVDRLWANGSPLNIPGLVTRIYKGTDDQLPDPIISAIDVAVPAFRGTAYIVFEDFPLDDFGARLPQINAEVIRVPPSRNNHPRLETMVRGVNLIPASGEFSYATQIAEETPTESSARPLNMNNLSGKADIELALDQLETQLPNVQNVSIITAWFGTDLRCGECRILPGIETKIRITPDVTWQVSGIKRGTAYLVSQDENGRPNYGGTPSDKSILEAIAALKSRGYKVTLYPFILMDIPGGNNLPDPYGGTEQAPFPWRGRISCHPLSAENTNAVTAQISDFFGNCLPSHFGTENGLPNYSGPDEFSYRRFILHYARLAQISGGVDRFIIGSEMRSLTTLRDGQGDYPAVDKLTELASDVSALLGPQTGMTYAADWSEYFGHHPSDGSGDVSFHLDPLWSSDAIDAIGIDAYFPLSDWRENRSHLDEDMADSPYDIYYLKSQMQSGEGYDYFYASQFDRDAQNRTAITDGAASKPWVYRYKDLRNWWSQPHYNRRSGLEDEAPTEWEPQSKPIWLMEIGCPAIHNGAHQPNVFFDAKSSESHVPYFSNGARDDLIQRRYLEAFIDYWAEHNPQSQIYDGPMIDPDMINVWCWDARPFPDFPARDRVWSDGENWQRGHWLSGRMGLVPLSDIVTDICNQSGLTDVDTLGVTGLVQGYHLDRPMTGRAALTPLSALYGFNLIETSGGLRFKSDNASAPFSLSADDIVGDLSQAVSQIKSNPEERLKDVRIHFIDTSNDYQLGLASARDQSAETVRISDINAPVVMDRSFALFAADQILDRSLNQDRSLNFTLASSRLDLEVGDYLSLPISDDIWQIQSLEGLTSQRVSVERRVHRQALPLSGSIPNVSQQPLWIPKPLVIALDLPGFNQGLLVGVVMSPFSAASVKGPNSEVNLPSPVFVGALLTDLKRGPIGRWDYQTVLDIFLPAINLSSLTEDEILSGRNRFAVETQTGWEIFQAVHAELVAPNVYRLSQLLRGLDGSHVDMMDIIQAGARVAFLDNGWKAIELPPNYIGETVNLTAEAGGRPSDLIAFNYRANHLRPLAPVHAKIDYRDGLAIISWIRQSRIGGDNWGGLDIPLGEDAEIYLVQLLSEGQSMSEYEVTEPQISISISDLLTIDQIGIAQGSQIYGWGAELIIDT